ncbi:MAG: SpoIID/LytB domain-containing protein [Elusimicrobia bacterium]|nr:SpoIID/LytB domain-containing protein [Elusimicrobiota bacterium]
MKYVKLSFLIIFLSSCLYSQNNLTLNDAISESQKFNYEESLKIIKKLPQTPDVLKHLAWAHLKAGNYRRALKKFLLCDQNDYEVLFGLGFTYFLKGDYEEAFIYFTICLEINKDCAAAEYFCGEIKNLQGFYDEAIKSYKNTVKLDYNFIEARLKLAQVYYSTKQYDNSFREWSSIINVDPQLKEAQQQKENLLALITKKPEEIIPPKRISKSSVITSVPKAEKVPLLRIGISGNIKEINLWSDGGIGVYKEGKMLFQTGPKEIYSMNNSSDIFKYGKVIIKPKLKNSTIIVKDVKYAGGFAWADVSDREYRGFFEVNFTTTTMDFSIINIVNVEEYLYSVLPSEMISSWPEEALKSQAVIARGEAFYKKEISKPHIKSGFDLCDDQHCQVYKGVKQETASARKAVDSTRGEILEYNGKMAHTLYSSNCSGHTQSSKDLKGWGDEPYLYGVVDGNLDFPDDLVKLDNWIKHPPDIFCAPSKYTYYAESRWIRVITQDEISEQLNRTYKIGKIKKIITVKRAPSGHISNLRFEGTEGDVEVEKENLIRAVALGRLRSTNFIVEGYGKSSDLPKYFVFWGAGWGHAVGLCQSGAAGMAEKVYKYDEILKKYYRNTYLRKLPYN